MRESYNVTVRISQREALAISSLYPREDLTTDAKRRAQIEKFVLSQMSEILSPLTRDWERRSEETRQRLLESLEREREEREEKRGREPV